jgi:hypothetical protein
MQYLHTRTPSVSLGRSSSLRKTLMTRALTHASRHLTAALPALSGSRRRGSTNTGTGSNRRRRCARTGRSAVRVELHKVTRELGRLVAA